MSSWVCSVNDIGRAPNFSWFARARADSMVKLPVMLAWPLVMAACVVGAEMTCLSRTMANWFRTPCRPTSRVVTSPNFFAPSPVNFSWTSTTFVGWPFWDVW